MRFDGRVYGNQCIFCPKFKDVYFCTKLCILTHLKVLILNITSFSKLQPKNTQIGDFWFQIQSFFVYKTLRLHMFVSAGLKYDNRFFKFQLKNIKIRHFAVNLKIFSISMKLYILKISRVLISNNMTIAFQNCNQKPPRQCFFSHKFKGFCFCMKLCLLIDLRCVNLNYKNCFCKFKP